MFAEHRRRCAAPGAHTKLLSPFSVTTRSETPLSPPSASAVSSGTSVRKGVYTLLIVVAASIVGVRILTAPGAFSVNDQSRWATIRALVETGRYAIGHRVVTGGGRYRDRGIISQPGWGTVDVVMHPQTRQFYSSKPTLLPTLLAGEYWVLRNVFGLNLSRNRLAVSRTILLTINLLPFVFYLLLFGRLADRLGTTDWGRLFVLATAGFGTFVSAFLPSLNNHTVAATGALFALYHCLIIQIDGDRSRWRFVLAGLFAGWTMCNELPAAALAAALGLWLLSVQPRGALQYALPAMLLPVAGYLLTQYLATGTIVPTYARESWYRFAGSYWHNPVGIDLADEPKLLYAFNLLVGHTGILSLTPVLVLGWIGMVRGARAVRGAPGNLEAQRLLAWLTLALTAVTFAFYVIRTHNYGGIVAGPRWFFWLIPLWLLTMLPEADRWGLDPRRRRIAYALLALSIGSAAYALENPWRNSWLSTLLRDWGVIAY